MGNSLYQDDIQLIYQLSHGISTSIRYDPFIIGAVLITLRLMREHIGMTLSITRVPVLDSSSNQMSILEAPDSVLRDFDKQRIWATDYTRCKSVAGIYFCPNEQIAGGTKHPVEPSCRRPKTPRYVSETLRHCLIRKTT